MNAKQSHKEWRKAFREGVFKRDKNKCRICQSIDNLDAHHIIDRHEMPNGGYVISNGISLCPQCHLKAEKYHSSHGQWHDEGFHPMDLFDLIDSSYGKAYEDSKLLDTTWVETRQSKFI